MSRASDQLHLTWYPHSPPQLTPSQLTAHSWYLALSPPCSSLGSFVSYEVGVGWGGCLCRWCLGLYLETGHDGGTDAEVLLLAEPQVNWEYTPHLIAQPLSPDMSGMCDNHFLVVFSLISCLSRHTRCLIPVLVLGRQGVLVSRV